MTSPGSYLHSVLAGEITLAGWGVLIAIGVVIVLRCLWWYWKHVWMDE